MVLKEAGHPHAHTSSLCWIMFYYPPTLCAFAHMDHTSQNLAVDCTSMKGLDVRVHRAQCSGDIFLFYLIFLNIFRALISTGFFFYIPIHFDDLDLNANDLILQILNLNITSRTIFLEFIVIFLHFGKKYPISNKSRCRAPNPRIHYS